MFTRTKINRKEKVMVKEKILYEEANLEITELLSDVITTSGNQNESWSNDNVDSGGWT